MVSDCCRRSPYKWTDKDFLGVVQNCHHFHECTHHNPYCDSLPKRVLWKCWFVLIPYQNCNAPYTTFKKKYTPTFDSPPKITLCMHLKMITILDDPRGPLEPERDKTPPQGIMITVACSSRMLPTRKNQQNSNVRRKTISLRSTEITESPC